MRHPVIFSIFLSGMLSLSPAISSADDINAVFMVTRLNDGQTQSLMLTNNDDFVGPRLFPSDGTIRINDTTYDIGNIQDIRFEQHMVDAIQIVGSDTTPETDGSLYNLSGQMLGQYTVLPGDLPKGIYIWHGKKIIIK